MEPSRWESSPDPFSGPVGSSQGMTLYEYDSMCGQFTVGPYAASGVVGIYSDNTSVATLNSGTSMVNFVGPGNANIVWQIEYYHLEAISAEDCGLVVVPTEEPCPVQTVSVTIDDLMAVGKNQTAGVKITLSPSTVQGGISLQLSTTSGTGSAKFNSNNSTTLSISQTSTVTIKGVTESSTANNIRLQAKSSDGSKTYATKDFTVLRVTLSLRDGSDGNVTSNNSGGITYVILLGSSTLGTFQSSGSGNHLWRTGVEIVGVVEPGNYTGSITIQREISATRTYTI